jgi:hypothetical protein
MRQKVMILGAGVLGAQVLEQLATRNPTAEFLIIARDEEKLQRRVNLAKYVFSQWNEYPNIAWEKCDILNTDSMVGLFLKYSPDIVFNATTPFPWWHIDALPEEFGRLAHKVGPGMWCALDAILPYKISKIMELAAFEGIFVNGCYPDAINCFLWDQECGPTVGIGNISNVIPGLRLAFAKHLNVDPLELSVRIVGHHYTSLNAPVSNQPNSSPFALEISSPGENIYVENEDWPFELFRQTFPRTRGLQGQSVTVSSATVLLHALMNGVEMRLHAPGPNGLVGGYPIHLTGAGDIVLDLPARLDIERARDINRRGQVLDGLDHVKAGSMKGTGEALEAFKTIVGFELPEVTLHNVEAISQETVNRLNHAYHLGLGLQ